MEMKKLITKKTGFTLVELLIVIALIAVLSVAVLATINPIEQTNKARDAKFKNDAAEVLGALERYYASQNAYPWNLVGDSHPNTWIGSIDGTAPEFGILGEGSTGDGALIVTSELKTTFRGKESFSLSVAEQDRMYVYHDGTANSSYVCFTPKATANRTGAMVAKLKCLSGVGDDATLVDYGTGGCTAPSPWVYGIGDTNANLLCVPE